MFCRNQPQYQVFNTTFSLPLLSFPWLVAGSLWSSFVLQVWPLHSSIFLPIKNKKVRVFINSKIFQAAFHVNVLHILKSICTCNQAPFFGGGGGNNVWSQVILKWSFLSGKKIINCLNCSCGNLLKQISDWEFTD